jgi:hypothetical protein
VRFALIMLILLLLSAAAEARYMLDTRGQWVKCVPDGSCETVPLPGTIPFPPVPRLASRNHHRRPTTA